MNSDENNLFEGIGNEVLIFLTGLVVVSLVSYYVYQRFMSSRFNRIINNDHIQNDVQEVTLRSNRLSDENSDSSNTMNRGQRYGSDQQCPVCLNEFQYPIETNCGHLFCALCVINYWRHGNWIGAVRCPVCRTSVTALMTCFRINQIQDAAERSQITNEINDYNRRYSGEPRPWLDYLWDLPTLLRHAASEFLTFGGIMYMFRFRVLLCFIAAIMYLISPLDMIPEAIFGILGLLDDVFVMLLIALYISVIYRRVLSTRWQNQ